MPERRLHKQVRLDPFVVRDHASHLIRKVNILILKEVFP